MATVSYEHDAEGGKFIPATQRPDGTWRKPRRIRDGYVPQEEIPLYESKGKQFSTRQTSVIPGLTAEIIAQAQQKTKKKESGNIQPIHGMVITVDKNKKKKKKKTGVDDAADKLAKVEIVEPNFSEPKPSPSKTQLSTPSSPSIQQDPVKRLKNLRKKLREIEILEEKIKAGLLKTPDKDQKEKMSKKSEVLTEIEDLEKLA